ncbi:MAG: transposase [Phycisphaerales bacterium]|nr:transposase [Phycisphaerales bacterium]
MSTAERSAVVAALVEGSSINSTVRMTGVSKPTILKLLADLGRACQEFHDARVTGLRVTRIQCDEIWAFCYAKAKNVPESKLGTFGVGDVWTWTALCPDTKLMAHWAVGMRDTDWSHRFMRGLAPRLSGRIQITTDGHHSYPSAIRNVLNARVETDYAKCVKKYGDVRGEGKYSPCECTGVDVKVMWGKPDRDHISTSLVERANLTMRMGMRRYTRLTNGFSKKVENHAHMTAIFFTYYNFCRVHQSIKTTPAVAAGIVDQRWEIADLIRLLD